MADVGVDKLKLEAAHFPVPTCWVAWGKIQGLSKPSCPRSGMPECWGLGGMGELNSLPTTHSTWTSRTSPRVGVMGWPSVPWCTTSSLRPSTMGSSAHRTGARTLRWLSHLLSKYRPWPCGCRLGIWAKPSCPEDPWSWPATLSDSG